MEPLAVIREGSGPEVLLVHGGASPPTTWRGLEPLAARWTLAYVHRRGYPPSPPQPGRGHDFAVDADDLEPLLASGPHLVAHSYGVLGALLAAERAPDRLASVTVIEPPLGHYVTGDPEVAELERLGEEFLTQGLDMDPERLRTFLRLSGAPGIGPGPIPDDVVRGIRRSHGGRLPSEARPDLDALRDAGVPALVASGAHHAGMERICDVIADRLAARRVVAPGAGHFIPAAPGFADELERFFAAI